MADLSESIWNLVLQLLKTLYLHYHNTFRHQNCRGGVLKWVAPTHNVTWPFHHMVLRDNVTNWKHYIFTTRVPMAIKLGRMVTYRNELRSKKSEDFLIIMSSDEIPCQTKIFKSPLPQWVWLPNFANWWLALRGYYRFSYMVL